MKWHRQQDGACQNDAENYSPQPGQPRAGFGGTADQEHQGRDSLGGHRQTHNPSGATLVFHGNLGGPVHTDGCEERIVHQLDEPDDARHHTRRDQIEDQLHHVATIRHAARLWLTERMSEAEPHVHEEPSYGHDVQAALAPITRQLRELIPDVYKGFGGLHAAAFRAGALDAKTKELVALAIAITTKCDGCIAAHAKGAARNGASDAEVAELIGVTISMNGGPGTVYGPRAFAAFREFKNS